MPLKFQEMSLAFPEQLWIPISPDLLDISESDCSNHMGYYHGRLNALCLQAFIAGVTEYLDERPVVWPSPEAARDIWDCVNGTAIALGSHRVVLIPSDALDTTSLTISQEWVDIPQWSADIYVGAQVDEEQGWVQFWGFASHQMLKQEATYNSIYCQYELDRDFMVNDLELLGMVQSLGIHEKAILDVIPILRDEEANVLIEQLSVPLPYSPRLEVEFEKWAALMADDELRSRLYHWRLQAAHISLRDPMLSEVSQTLGSAMLDGQEAVVNAALWFQDQLDQVAQDLQWKLMPTLRAEPVALRESTQELELVLANLARSTQGFEVPRSARLVEHELQIMEQRFKVYILVWPIISAQSRPEWSLLVVIAGTEDCPIMPGTALMIHDDQELLVEVLLQEDSIEPYLCGAVSGYWDESFRVSIRLPDEASVSLPPIAYQPEVS